MIICLYISVSVCLCICYHVFCQYVQYTIDSDINRLQISTDLLEPHRPMKTSEVSTEGEYRVM